MLEILRNTDDTHFLENGFEDMKDVYSQVNEKYEQFVQRIESYWFYATQQAKEEKKMQKQWNGESNEGKKQFMNFLKELNLSKEHTALIVDIRKTRFCVESDVRGYFRITDLKSLESLVFKVEGNKILKK